MKRTPKGFAVLLLCSLLALAGCGSGGSVEQPTIVVDTLEDAVPSPAGKATLRAAILAIPFGGRIVFDNSLNGGTIDLTIVGSDTSVLKGEIYSGMTFQGYGERNYGKSALYAAKDLTIDASALPDGITLRWAGGDANPARVLAVYGNLTLRNVNISSGVSRAEPIAGGAQPYTLARGGGIAAWGIATLTNCTVWGNRCAGENTSSRDRGTYGGGIFANALVMDNSIVSGNSVVGYGAAGGGIYSVGGADGPGKHSSLSGCTVTGNRVTAQHAYGGGIFTLGGGPNYLMSFRLSNCTVARNVVEDHPDLGESPSGYYYRGGGVYMGGGYLAITSCTIAENQVTGIPEIFNRKPNMGGGGIAATVGNAHVVENITIRQSIVAGNMLNAAPDDLFTGSVLHFYSHGYNLIGRLDFRQILVPIPPWMSLSRKHWPKEGDADNVAITDVLASDNVVRHASIVSVGADDGQLAVLWYPPKGRALDSIPAGGYSVDNVVLAEYQTFGKKDDFLPYLLDDALSTRYYGGVLEADFGTKYRTAYEAAIWRDYGIGSLGDVMYYENAAGWPGDKRDYPWIDFWWGLDNAFAGRLGAAGLGDDFWRSLGIGQFPLTDNVVITVTSQRLGPFRPETFDQLGKPRLNGTHADIGAIER